MEDKAKAPEITANPEVDAKAEINEDTEKANQKLVEVLEKLTAHAKAGKIISFGSLAITTEDIDVSQIMHVNGPSLAQFIGMWSMYLSDLIKLAPSAIVLGLTPTQIGQVIQLIKKENAEKEVARIIKPVSPRGN